VRRWGVLLWFRGVLDDLWPVSHVGKSPRTMAKQTAKDQIAVSRFSRRSSWLAAYAPKIIAKPGMILLKFTVGFSSIVVAPVFSAFPKTMSALD
jgi:hypothetical protein